MREPGGTSSGTRWASLALWVRWPRSAIHTLTGMIWFQSSGRERALSPTNDRGLTQINGCNAGLWQRVMRNSYYVYSFVAEQNLRFALYIWKSQGGRFKPAWAGDPAVEAVE